jgi:hypothetical protein
LLIKCGKKAWFCGDFALRIYTFRALYDIIIVAGFLVFSTVSTKLIITIIQ